MNNSQNEIAVFVVFFGEWPDWIQYFIYSCSLNQQIDFIIISDSNPLLGKYTNIRYQHQTVDGLCSLIKDKLGISVVMDNPYKLCDFKPTYGILFKEYLSFYNFWGYCDVDLIFGENMQFVVLKKTEAYDIILGYAGFASGPFALFRNCQKVNILFTQVTGFQNKLSSDTCLGFDEHIIKPENKGLSFKKGIYFLLFIMGKPKYIFNYRLLKYRFQWYFKRLTVNKPVDFTEVLYLCQKKKKLNINFSPFITNDTDFHLLRIKNWEVFYKSGKLLDMNSKELVAFHFRAIKNRKDFKVEVKPPGKSVNFIINKNGFRANE